MQRRRCCRVCPGEDEKTVEVDAADTLAPAGVVMGWLESVPNRNSYYSSIWMQLPRQVEQLLFNVVDFARIKKAWQLGQIYDGEILYILNRVGQ